MRKRLRKKRHLGEYRQYGFSVVCDVRRDISAPEFDQFVDSFIENVIPSSGLRSLCRDVGNAEKSRRRMLNRIAVLSARRLLLGIITLVREGR